MWKKFISHSWVQQNLVLLVFCLVVVGFVTFITNNKLIFVWLMLATVPLFFATKSIFASIYLNAIFATQLAIGKWYSILAIPGKYMVNPSYSEGFLTGWAVTPLNIFCISLILLGIRDSFTDKIFYTFFRTIVRSHQFLISLLLLYFFVGISSSWFISPYPLVSLVLLFQQFQLVILFFSTIFFFRNNINARNWLRQVLFVMICLQAVIGLQQLISGGTIGLGIEVNQGSGLGQGLDDPKFFRPIGTFAHANQYGLIQAVYGCIYLGLLAKNTLFGFEGLSILASIFSLLISYSRTVWFAVAMPLYLLLRQHEVKITLFLNKINWKRYWLHVVVMVGSVLVFLLPRLLLTFNSFYEGAGISTRTTLIQQGLSAARYHLLFGTGINTNEIMIFTYFPNGIISYFPVAVHMAYVQILIDSGLVGLLAFVLCLWLVFRVRASRSPTTAIFFYKSALGLFCTYYVFQPHIAMIEFPILGIVVGIIVATEQKQA